MHSSYCSAVVVLSTLWSTFDVIGCSSKLRPSHLKRHVDIVVFGFSLPVCLTHKHSYQVLKCCGLVSVWLNTQTHKQDTSTVFLLVCPVYSSASCFIYNAFHGEAVLMMNPDKTTFIFLTITVTSRLLFYSRKWKCPINPLKLKWRFEHIWF